MANRKGRPVSKYKGVLNKPMDLDLISEEMANISLLSTEDIKNHNSKALDKNQSDFLNRVSALFEHYNIDPQTDSDPFVKLALSLACEYVPGFKIHGKETVPGRPNEYAGDKGVLLHYNFLKYKRELENSGHTKPRQNEVFSEIVRKEAPYKGDYQHNIPQGVSTLKRRYREIKQNNLIVKLLLKMQKVAEFTDDEIIDFIRGQHIKKRR